MAKYSAVLKRTASTSLAVGAITVATSNPRRAKIYDLLLGSEAMPADNAFLWRFQRCTDDGTPGSDVTPQPLDSSDPAATTEATQAHTVNPTLTSDAVGLELALNQRATFRWVAAPDSELVIPATASNGFAVLTPTATALAVTCTVLFEEL